MFTPPRLVKTEVFARLPDALRVADRESDWLTAQRRGAQLHSFLEGPAFDRSGNLYCVDIPFGRIFRVGTDGAFELVVEYDGEPNGLKVHKDGRIFVADHKNGIMVLDPESGRIRPYLDRPRLERFKGVNDLVFASNGDLYFTDQGQSDLSDPSGQVYRLRATGQLDVVLSGVPSPNGLVLDLPETSLLVAVTRSNSIWRTSKLLDERFSKVGVFIRLSGGVGPDGLALDTQGNLAVCHAGFGVVWLFSPIGEPIARIQSCEGLFPTNVAYGGADNKSLFITEAESGSILRAELEVPGRPMFSHLP